jgi:hypothetical protein
LTKLFDPISFSNTLAQCVRVMLAWTETYLAYVAELYTIIGVADWDNMSLSESRYR